MKKFRKTLTKYSIFFILLLCHLILLFLQPDLGARSLALTRNYIMEMLSVVPPVFLLMGLMDVWVPKEMMMQYMGPGAGLRGGLFAFLLGSFSSGPLYAAFPIASMFLKKGCSLVNVFLFLGAWSTAKIPMLLFEITQLGSAFAGLRFVFNTAGIILLASFVEKTTSEEEKDSLLQKTRQLSEE